MRLTGMVISILLCLAQATPAAVRLWSDRRETRSFEAELVGFDGTTVTLRTTDGKLERIALQELSAGDQAYVRIMAGPAGKPGAPPMQAGPNGARPPESPGAAGRGLADLVEPAVVSIRTDHGTGSGFVVDPQGVVVTCYHVIEGAREVSLTFRDGTKLQAEGYLTISPGKDLALLQVRPGKKLSALAIATEVPQKLDKVAAFGGPRGFAFSASMGEVSAIRVGSEIRQIFLENRKPDIYRALGYDLDVSWIQNTTPISPGNSGGPLVNMQGQLVGVNAWREPTGQNLNFALAAKEVDALLQGASRELRSFAMLPSPRVPPPQRSPGDSRRSPRDRDSSFRIELPSGKVLDSTAFVLDRTAAENWVRKAYDSAQGSVVLLYHPNGQLNAIAGVQHGVLDGPTMAFYADKALMVYATYDDGKRSGLLRTYDAKGQKVYWCDYKRGSRQGLCCFFTDDSLRLALECKADQIMAIHLITGNALERTFDTMAEAMLDDAAKSLLTELRETEDELAGNEKAFKQAVKEEDQRLRQLRVSQINPQRRANASRRMQQRTADRDAVLGALRRLSGL